MKLEFKNGDTVCNSPTSIYVSIYKKAIKGIVVDCTSNYNLSVISPSGNNTINSSPYLFIPSKIVLFEKVVYSEENVVPF